MSKSTKSTKSTAPTLLSPMLENSFGSAIENRVAEMNNHLAREGRFSTDPLVVLLKSIRSALKENGFSFDRVATVIEAAAPATAKAPRAPKAAKAAKAPKAAKTPRAPKAAAAPAPDAPPAAATRRITPEELEGLQVAGTVTEAAPYGTDAEGARLAPYDVKKDGTPMKRRGRVAAAPVAAAPKAAKAPRAPKAAAAAPVVTTTVTVEGNADDLSPEALDALLAQCVVTGS